jgi:tripartite-type tricarboxylate transporter receptor subunit TctC
MFLDKRSMALAAVAALGCMAGAAHGQAYPAKPVRMLVAFPPGGISDALSRVVSQQLNTAWGQQVLVDNRPGAGTTLAADLVAKAPADGYTAVTNLFAAIGAVAPA